ncbi:MAG: indolepyruvate ferredoxin oxidoreductase subunit alpha [Alphaproteobacteria bacterium]|nr:indolepyruvate ferredoxin oxidoreductase subunit alpha [Alphaproteobacteria bacterium]
MRSLMSGNEAVARGAYEAGACYAAGYPGTPSTEILENLAIFKGDVIAEWSPNEKVALESAIGASIAGARALAAMKMVGVNVAADPLFSASYSGVNGGLVLVSADDPGLHSSQNEQDNRHYAPFAKLPMLEPSDSQEAKDMVKAAFEISEAFDAPVLLRVTTRICHSKSLVTLGERAIAPRRLYPLDMTKFNLVPALARRQRARLETKLQKLAGFSETCEFNRVEWNGQRIGVITSGISYQYAREVFGDTASYLKLGFTHPLPKQKIRDFASRVDMLYVIEELDPYLESQVRQLGISCIGKDKIPDMYELDPAVVAKSLLGIEAPVIRCAASAVPPRPPVLCAGCPHRGFFYELGKIARRHDVIISGDIGCYALGGNDPLDALDLCICMGAAPSMAHGAQKVFNKFGERTRVVATIGDSTFFHTGIPALINTVYNRSNTVTCILDNRTTGMTGQQDNPGSGTTLQGAPTKEIDIEAVVRAIGIDHVRVVNPMDLPKLQDTLAWAFGLDEPSVIVTKWPCTLKPFDRQERDEYAHKFKYMAVAAEDCTGCERCLNLGCPALSFDHLTNKASIDASTCNGCGLCAQVCKWSAVVNGELQHA